MVPAALHFVYELLELRQRKLLGILYAVSFLIAVVTLGTGLVVASVGENVWGYFAKVGPLKYTCTAFSGSLYPYSVFLLLRYRYKKGRAVYHEVNITLLAFTIALMGAVADLLPTVGVSFYPAGMITNTAFVMLISYGAFEHQLMGVLSRPQPRLILASLTYSLIASGIALTFSESASNNVFVFLLGFLFLAFNAYHFYDDIAYLMKKYLKSRGHPFLYKTVHDASVLFNDKDIGIVALGRQREILFANRRAARILGKDVIENKSLSFLENDILHRKLVKYCTHRRETIIDVDRETCAEIVPIELGGYLGTLICFYPKSKRHIFEEVKRTPRFKHINLMDIFPDE